MKKETRKLNEFQEGDKVKNRSGEILTVVYQSGLKVFVEEYAPENWFHPSNLTLVEKEGK